MNTTKHDSHPAVAGQVDCRVRPLRKTNARLVALEDLARGLITHPGPGVASVLEKAGAIRWDRPANTFRITEIGIRLAREWDGVCVVSVPADWLTRRPNVRANRAAE